MHRAFKIATVGNVDTRIKILDRAAAVHVARELREKGKRLVVVTGYFDVLLADAVRRLQSRAGDHALMAIVLEPSNPILTISARAELVAALRVIDYVCPATDADTEQLLYELQADEICREELADQRRTEDLAEHVRRRQAR